MVFQPYVSKHEKFSDCKEIDADGNDIEQMRDVDLGNYASNDQPDNTDDGGKNGNDDDNDNDKPRSSPRRWELMSHEERTCIFCGCGFLIIVLLVTAISLIAVSLRKVDETEYGVKYAQYKKELDDAAVTGGLFAGPPGFKFIKFPSTYLTADFADRTCVSRDGLLVKFSVTFQYRMTADNILPAIIKYRDNYKWREIVEQGGLSAMHHSCGDFYISDFQNKRSQIQERMLDNLRLKLEGDPDDEEDDGVNALAVSVQLRNLQLPSEYNEAVEAKQAAEEDIALAVAQRKQETTKAQTELLKAQEEARKILDTANNDADVMLTEAQLKANETTFAFTKEAETLFEVKNSLNLTTDGVLTYLANTLLSDVDNLAVTMSEPARLGRLEEL